MGYGDVFSKNQAVATTTLTLTTTSSSKTTSVLSYALPTGPSKNPSPLFSLVSELSSKVPIILPDVYGQTKTFAISTSESVSTSSSSTLPTQSSEPPLSGVPASTNTAGLPSQQQSGNAPPSAGQSPQPQATAPLPAGQSPQPQATAPPPSNNTPQETVPAAGTYETTSNPNPLIRGKKRLKCRRIMVRKPCKITTIPPTPPPTPPAFQFQNPTTICSGTPGKSSTTTQTNS
ncbi:hypothetical protein MT418_002934 [Batrachochytrium dendrobatidis]